MLVPTEGDDYIRGSTAAELLTGLGGNDTIDGGGGEDIFEGGLGNDTYLAGQAKNTYVFSRGDGYDIVRNWDPTRQGQDVLRLSGGILPEDITLIATDTTLLIRFSADSDFIELRQYFDPHTLQASGGTIVFDNGVIWDGAEIAGRTHAVAAPTEGNDTLAAYGASPLHALGGDDIISAGSGAVVFGDAGKDSLTIVEGGGSALDGGDGDDDLHVNKGNGNTLRGADGADTLEIVSGDGNVLWGQAGDDFLAIRNGAGNELHGGDGNDALKGTIVRGTVYGDDGDDTANFDGISESVFHGGTGNDSLITYVGTGSQFYGDEGNDTLYVGGGSNLVSGGMGADQLTSGSSNNSIFEGDDGADVLSVIAGNDNILDGGIGNDKVSYGYGQRNVVLGGEGDDEVVAGGYLATIVDGEAGNDQVTVNVGSAVIRGGAGDDIIHAGYANQMIIGGQGLDTIYADNGSDVIAFNRGDGQDIVRGGASTTATLSLGGGIVYADLKLSRAGTDLILSVGGGEQITFADWYSASGANKVVTILQMVVEGSSDYQATSSDELSNKKIQGFDFRALVSAFDAQPAGTSAWSLFPSLAASHLSAADAQSIGGDLAYQYGLNGILLGQVATFDVLSDSNFGNVAQQVHGKDPQNRAVVADASDDVLRIRDGEDTLDGGAGNNTLLGGNEDTSAHTAGTNLFDGGAGNDSLTGGTGNELFIGGGGNDTITTSTGADIVAFNRGDGADTIIASMGKDNTVSLGKGISYADLLFSKSNDDLVLSVGGSEQLTFKDWYLDTSNHSVATLQMLVEGGDYDASSTDPLKNKKVEHFNFDGLVDAFDQARTANPALTSWALSSSLLSFHLSGSDTAVIGGDLAYQYGQTGNLPNISLTPAQAVLGAGQFGTAAQAIQQQSALQDPSIRLS